MPSKLDQLKAITDVVADTGDIDAIREYQPVDATTNPSLLLKVADLETYAGLLAQAKREASKANGSDQESLDLCCDRFAVGVGKEICSIVSGRVSTEVDARLSFRTDATVARARGLIDLYEAQDVTRDRVLIKIASTWEGIAAAEILEKEGINCNLTLLFSFEQAVACADAGVFLISPFVGRILDWWKKATGETYTAETDPGVLSVRKIFNYYKTHSYSTVVMGASFRNTEEVEALAGCDRLTIAPMLLAQLSKDHSPLEQKLFADKPADGPGRVTLDEAAFRWAMNQDAMATEKLAEGIRLFATDQIALEKKFRA
ncbi:MAG: transaldolase [Proteobacteria bacterium]|nr:transaldolase [Pseudomonadota bacterium]